MNLNFLLAGAASGNVIQIVMIVGMIAIFYFLLIRPQKKQEKAANAMRDALQIGDEVTTIGGIIGAIVSIKEETVVIETTRDGTKIRFLRSAIRSVDVKAEDAQKN
jgi:preprotein translocase subunit YajC